MQLLSDFFQTLPHFCLFTTLHPLFVHIPVTLIPFSLFLFIFSIVLKKHDFKIITNITLVLGLFGTITGMIEVFHLLAVTGGGDAKAMAGGVSRSTIPAMAGLSVAITGTFASTFLKNKSKREEELLSEHLVSE